MEEKIIKSLIELYRSKGLDVTALVNDPTFITLPFAERVRVVKEYAAELSRDTSTAITKQDIKNFLKETAMGAAAGALMGTIGALHVSGTVGGADPFRMASSVGRAIKGTTLAGLTLGAASAGLRGINNVMDRKEMHEQALKLKNDPTDENAIKMIALRYMQPGRLVQPNMMFNLYDKYNNKYLSQVMDSRYTAGREVLDEFPNNPPAERPDAAAIQKEYQRKIT